MQMTSAKVLQVQASFKGSLALLDSKKIFWWGTNNNIKLKSTPTELNFTDLLKDI